MKTLLIVDDEPAVLEALRLLFEGKYRVLTAPTATGALASLRQHAADVAILDLSLPDMDGLILLPRLREEDIEVIVLTGRDSARDGVQAMKLGALDYIVKPYDTPTLVETVRKAADLHDKNRQIQFLRSSAERDRTFIAESESLRRVLQEIARVATTDATVLITGESGTGKEMVAHLIHRTSPRATGPFVTINCGAIPESLIESELFGHERGAFTGARERKTGKFEMAHGGTIFLDEISVLPPESQTRLLRVLQERTIARVGGTQDIPVDIRVISATNLSLQNLVREGRFREDLFYRLHVCPVNLPPLRERREDIPPLLHHFLNLFGRQFHRPAPSLSPIAAEILSSHHWPGNIRELENLAQRLVLLSPGTGTIQPHHLPDEIRGASVPRRETEHTLKNNVDSAERRSILDALRKTNGNRLAAADVLGVHRNTLLRLMKKHAITA